MTDYVDGKGRVKKLYKPNAFQLENNKMYSQYGGLTEDVQIGDTVEFKFTEKAKDGKIYNNIVDGSLKVISQSKAPASEGANMNRPDWDAIAEGKIRSLLLQAHVQKSGLVPLTDDELKTLHTLVKIAMGDDKMAPEVLRKLIHNIIKIEETNQGIDMQELILRTKASPADVTEQVKALLEEGIIYEPRPGRVRSLE